MASALESSLYFSLFVQLITIAIGLFGLTFTLHPKDEILRTVVGLETAVSGFQFSFYLWYTYHLKAVAEATFYRYHDWVITTPLMLFTTMIYYNYNNEKEKEETVKTFWEKHRSTILHVVGFNAIMLLFGYLYERNVLDLVSSNTLGFVGLIGSFYVIYDSFVSKNLTSNLPLFIFMSIIWAIYGVAATFTPYWKNVSYNLIDTISKNFYGIFLTYIAYQTSIKYI
jgi:hypothetical protein